MFAKYVHYTKHLASYGVWTSFYGGCTIHDQISFPLSGQRPNTLYITSPILPQYSKFPHSRKLFLIQTCFARILLTSF